jgi:hypothetical protein
MEVMTAEVHQVIVESSDNDHVNEIFDDLENLVGDMCYTMTQDCNSGIDILIMEVEDEVVAQLVKAKIEGFLTTEEKSTSKT